MEYWREYFRTAKGDVFEILEKAIAVAASDFPKIFRVRRDRIAEMLFNCALIKCSGCDNLELGVPGIDQRQAVVDNDNDDGDDLGNHKAWDNNYLAAEALTDEIEIESEIFNEVMRIKEIVDNHQNESESVLHNSLGKLQIMNISMETLEATMIGKSVNALRRHASMDVRSMAKILIEFWKGLANEWMKASAKTRTSEATPESLNPSVLDEEVGLPTPLWDDLAFLNTHGSMELSEFFDEMDEYGNPGNSGGFNNNHNLQKPKKPSDVPNMAPKNKPGSDVVKKKQPPIVKPSVAKPPVAKPPVAKPPVGKPPVVKPPIAKPPTVKPPIAKPIKPTTPESGPGRQLKPNVERKLQNGPKRAQETSHRRRDTDVASDVAYYVIIHETKAVRGATTEEKFEVAKRKLQEQYQEAETAKRQRTIQVMELHDLPKPRGISVRNPHSVRPGSNHNRHR